MDMTEGQRADLATRIQSKRLSDYGTRRAAYNAAQVNSATWTKAEAGDPIAERSLVAILKTFWPETGGDWRRLDPPLNEGLDQVRDIERAVEASPALSDTGRAQILALLAEERAREQRERGSA